MKSNYMLPSESVLLLEQVENKWDVIEHLILSIWKSPACRKLFPEKFDIDDLREALVSRESIQPTNVGHGAAFPHARIPELEKAIIGLTVLKKPVDFLSPHHDPVDIVMLFVVPEEDPAISLKLMAQMTRFLFNPENREKLREAETRNEIVRQLQDADFDTDASFIAEEIMRPLRFIVGADMSLRQVTHHMFDHGTNATVVVDDNMVPLGEITCSRLFQFGLPDFFSSLHSVAFIKDYDPFDKYFRDETKLKACDIMSDEFVTVPQDATLMELVFMLAIKDLQKVYVVNDNRVVGEISQNTLLDRIMN